MTGLTATEPIHIVEFKRFFTKNYNKLTQESVSIFKHHDYSQDFLHDSFLKVYHNFTAKTGFTGSYHAFIWRSIHNEMLMEYNRSKQKTFIDYDNELNHPVIEKELQHNHLDHENSQALYNALEFLCNQLFLFIEQRHSPVKANIFKHYFLGDHKRSTYQQLSKRTGYSTFYISTTIKTIKQDLKENFITFINNT
jgi:DNA-directed RNA polymerase specialized sigma24 family protein